MKLRQLLKKTILLGLIKLIKLKIPSNNIYYYLQKFVCSKIAFC